MEYLVGGIIGIVVAFAIFWLVAGRLLGSWSTLLRPRREEPEPSEDPGQRLAEHIAREMSSVRHGAQRTVSPNHPPSRPEPKGDADTPLYRALRNISSQSGERWNPYAPNQSRVYRVQAARRRAKSGTVNLYALLGVPIDASDEDITRAYRYHVSRIHPDKFQGDPRRQALAEQKLKQLNHAVHVLRDPARRARHDAALQI